MKRVFIILAVALCALTTYAQLPMHGWKLHLAYNNVTRVEMGSKQVFALSEGALFAVNKDDQSVEYFNRLTGLTSTNIADFKYDDTSKRLIIAYNNGHIDLVGEDGVTNISDLYHKQMNISKAVRNITVHDRRAYLAMEFGVVVLNLDRNEIADTYYLGENASEVRINAVAIVGDSIYAAGDNDLYCASLNDNLVDYSFWKKVSTLPGSGTIQNIVSYDNTLYLMRNSLLYAWQENTWKQVLTETLVTVKVSGNQLLAVSKKGTHVLQNDGTFSLVIYFVGAPDVAYDTQNKTYWFAYYGDGLGVYRTQENTHTTFLPSGPITNTAYRMRFQGERLYIVPGGYLGVPYNRNGCIMWYENGKWDGFTNAELVKITGQKILYDFCDILPTPSDPNHFYVASYGSGLLEFKDNKFYTRYDASNAPLESRIKSEPSRYTRIDALVFDDDGNLWMQNCSSSSTRVLTPDGKWYNFSNVSNYDFSKPKVMLIDNQNQNNKVFVNIYNAQAISVLNDNGTLTNFNDDKIMLVNTYIDDDGNVLTPKYLHSAAQDLNGALWIGTETGVIKFTNPSELFHSNKCTRIKIPRNDGSGLADYMLGEEQINAIVVDGANRIWFGTQTSGAYLMDLSDPQDVITVQHFTADNSPLPSNTILSIAINPISGEVFFGTGGGLVSYQSDAAEGKEDYSGAYAYPNPVKADFDGVITIAGLMENTHVRITDNGGNLVYETTSNGGLAIWDGKNGRGERVSSGVYFAMCVTADGASKTLVKILVMN